MCRICFLQQSEWEDFFAPPGYQSFNESFSNYKGNQTYKVQSHISCVYVYNCQFASIRSTSITYNSYDSSLMLVEYSSFNNCYNYGNGGAIFFAYSGQCVLSCVCGYQCHCISWGQLCYCFVSDRQNFLNHMIDSSVAFTKDTGCSTLEFDHGNLTLKKVNSSNNYVFQLSGVYLYSPSTTSYIIFSSFSNNTASSDRCIGCYWKSFEIIGTNIIENKQKTNASGIIYSMKCNLLLKECCVLGNTPCENIFYNDSGNFPICDNCSIDEYQNTSTVTFIKKPDSFFINSYHYLLLDGCNPKHKNATRHFENIMSKALFYLTQFFKALLFFSFYGDT